jgi:hypothetical protein
MATATSTGARVIFKVGGSEVIFANALSYTVAHAHQPVDVMGQPEPAEYAETGYTVNFTATLFRVNARGAESQGLRPRLEDLMRQPELSCTMVDKVDSSTLFTISRVKCTQEDFNVDARNLSQLVLSFVGIKMSESDSTRGESIDNEEKTTGVSRDI